MTQALEEYLNDPDFETNRKQYIEGKERGKSYSAAASTSTAAPSGTKTNEPKPAQPGISIPIV